MPFINHVSIRVPWHDDLWQGTVCKRPRDNGSCVVLPEIAESKRDELEACIAGRRFDSLQEDELPPCVKERATFMAPFTLRRNLTHPYKHSGSEAHSDLEVTALQQSPFTAACIPFKWMRREFADELAKGWRLDYDTAREPTEPQWLVESGWVQIRLGAKRSQSAGLARWLLRDHQAPGLAVLLLRQADAVLR